MEPVTIFFVIMSLWQFIPNDDCIVKVEPPVQYLAVTGDNKIVSYDTVVSCKQLNKELTEVYNK